MTTEHDSAKARVRGLKTPLSWLSATLMAFATAAGGYFLVARAWSSCDVGINGAANSFALVALFVPVWIVAMAWWSTVLTAVAGRWGLPAAALLGLVGTAFLLWGVMAWKHAPAGYPAFACPPDNIPPWWPAWLPI